MRAHSTHSDYTDNLKKKNTSLTCLESGRHQTPAASARQHRQMLLLDLPHCTPIVDPPPPGVNPRYGTKQISTQTNHFDHCTFLHVWYFLGGWGGQKMQLRRL